MAACALLPLLPSMLLMLRSLLLPIAAATAYRAGYVEHTAVSPCGQGTCGRQQRDASVATTLARWLARRRRIARQ